jgi:hypothetical protein
MWEGHVSLFNGLDLKGLRTHLGHWTAAGGALSSADLAAISSLDTEKAFGPCELIFDWLMPKGAESVSWGVEVGGKVRPVTSPEGTKAGTWLRQTIKVEKVDTPSPIKFSPLPKGSKLMNVFVRELKEEKK